ARQHLSKRAKRGLSRFLLDQYLMPLLHFLAIAPVAVECPIACIPDNQYLLSLLGAGERKNAGHLLDSKSWYEGLGREEPRNHAVEGAEAVQAASRQALRLYAHA